MPPPARKKASPAANERRSVKPHGNHTSEIVTSKRESVKTEPKALVLKYPPSANRLWRVFRGRQVLSAEARSYKSYVAAECHRQGAVMLSGDLRLFVDLYRPRKSGDLSNRVKILEDSLQGFCFKNDSQIVELYCRRFDDKANPRVEVRIERVDDRAELFPITRLITEARYIHV